MEEEKEARLKALGVHMFMSRWITNETRKEWPEVGGALGVCGHRRQRPQF